MADLRDKPAFTGEETKEQILEEGVSPYHKADIVAAKEETPEYQQYRLDKVIAHGTFGLVYTGTDLLTEGTVAIKRVY